MMPYLKGDKVEVLNTKGTLEDSWHPALIVDGDGDVYIVLYDGHVNGVVEEWVMSKYIRPCPPVVEFSNWSRGDLVHVFDNFAWKLATVLHVSKRKQFLVRVVGSMMDLNVDASWIRVRHYWQGDQWIVVGKGSSNSDAIPPHVHSNMFSQSRAQRRSIGLASVRRSSNWKSSNVPTMAVKRRAISTTNSTEAPLAKISRTVKRTSPGTLNQNEGCCTGMGKSGMILRFTKHNGLIRSPTETANLGMQYQDSGLSYTGSCSINAGTSCYDYTRKCNEHYCDDGTSDAESCTLARKVSNKKAVVDNRPLQQHCSLILRIRLQDPSLREMLC